MIWLAGVLKKLADDGVAEGPLGSGSVAVDGGRRSDSQGSVAVSLCRNGSGSYASVEIHQGRMRNNKTLLCIPAGRFGGGWRALAREIEQFVSRGSRGEHVAATVADGGVGDQEQQHSFVEVVQGADSGAKSDGLLVAVSLKFVTDERG